MSPCAGGFHWSISAVGYVVTFIIGCVAIPHIFPPVKVWTLFRNIAHSRTGSCLSIVACRDSNPCMWSSFSSHHSESPLTCSTVHAN